ncbi:MAG: thiolase family protein, partial [Dehalococcoidia bacterium]|nr:thiolase family protein [Dehalococcoidia bacterium]
VRQEELAHEVVKQVMDQTGLEFSEDGRGIDSSVAVSDDFWEARTISDVPLGDALGGHGRDTLKVAQDGSMGVLYSAATVLSGHDDIVLLAGGVKESQILSRNLLTNCGFDPIYIRKLGLDYVSAAALQANRYMHKFGITREQCAKVAVKNRKNALNNPFALAPMELTVQDVLKSRMLAFPITELEAYPVSDGAIAMIIASEEKAKKLTNKPVWIEGFGSCRDAHNPGERELADCDALVDSARQAYRMADIKNPVKDIDLFEISEHCSYQELLWTEGLGLCGRGGGGKLIDSGKTQLNGELPVNPSGGVLSGVPALLAGMSCVAEAFFQLRGEAGKRQVDKAKKALAHGTVGPCGQMHCVIILGR